MAAIDTSAWSAPVSDAEPSGPDLEFDADFGALDRAAQGKPEQQYGATVIPAEEPDWKEVDTLGRGLMDRTRDLRVVTHLAVARLRLGGLPDYAALLELTRQMVEERWEDLHPRLDPEDDNDPTLRANALLRLAHPGWVLRFLRDLPLANSPRLGRYGWRDVAVATGAITSDAPDSPSETTIRAAFQDTDPARLTATREAAAAAAAAVSGLLAGFEAHAGPGTGPDFEELNKLLRDMARAVERYSPTAADPAAGEEPAAEETDAEAADGAAPVAGTRARAGGMSAAALTEVTSRADALRLLDLAAQYYQRYEPSSPLPLLIRRARRLAELPFLDILRDLAPDGVDQARMMTGAREE
jgi:type VI secretion system protein ImpA